VGHNLEGNSHQILTLKLAFDKNRKFFVLVKLNIRKYFIND